MSFRALLLYLILPVMHLYEAVELCWAVRSFHARALEVFQPEHCSNFFAEIPLIEWMSQHCFKD
jgi:hypothetical protein